MIKVLHYLSGIAISDAEASQAAAARAEGVTYNFREARLFGSPERCEAVVSENADILAAYEAAGVPEYNPKEVPEEKEQIAPLVGAEPVKKKRGRPKKVVEPVAEETAEEPVVTPDEPESTDEVSDAQES